MPTLQIQLFGNFQLLYKGEPVAALNQVRLQSLLAYLVLHRNAPQARRHLAFLFWPDSTEAQAHANLRQLLHRLQRALPAADHFLQMDAKTVQWRPEAPFTLDVAECERHLTQAGEATRKGDEAALRAALQAAVASYQGDLLRGCYDDWVLPERERWQEIFFKALERLIRVVEAQRDYAVAISYAQRLLRADPLHETTYCQLMRLHALNGDRASALRVYHTCATLLQRELGVEPNPQTRSTYEHLLNLEGSPEFPSTHDTQHVTRTTHHGEQLIGRQAEWQTLLTTWRMAVTRRAHFLVVAGEAGIGKTRLAEELATWVGRQGIRIAHTRAYAAEGALAYAPVAEWLRTDALRAGWQGLDTVWLTELARIFPELLVEQPHLPPPTLMAESWQRKRLFEALARAVLANDRPLLLVLDNLQWCDRETLEWLHYLLRYDPQAPLLLVGTVRPEEVSNEHPLTMLLLDLRSGGRVTELELGPLNLDETAALAAQVTGQNLTPDAGQQLYQVTEGNPLFVVETVRAGGQERNEESPPVMGALAHPRSPSSLPVKVHAVIQFRLAHLSAQARDLASLAATIGRSFTFDVLARASDSSEETLVRGLDELWQRGIVREQGGNAYDFSHDRIREAAYAAISPVRRRVLHRRVAEALAGGYAEELDALSAQLAVHYQQAGLVEEALLWHQRAAAAARRLHATMDAIGHLKAALALLDAMPQINRRKAQQFVVLADLGAAQIMAHGYSSPEVEQTLTQARQLAVYSHDLHRLFQVFIGLRSFHTARGNLRAALSAIQEALLLAERLEEAELRAEAHYFYASSYAQMGDLESARTQFQQAEALRTDFTDVPPPVGLALWSLGYPHQALDVSQRSLAWADQRSEYFPMVNSMGGVAQLYVLLRKPRPLVSLAESVIAHAARFDYPQFHWLGMVLLGWAHTALGNSVEGMDWMGRGIDALRDMRFHTLQPFRLAMQAECYMKAGTLKDAYAALAEALSISERFSLRFWDAELYRLQGDLVLAQGGIEDEAIAYYRQAIEIAQTQHAKSLELRAVLSLSRLWQSQGRREEARQRLAEVYGWFSEGFDTLDLQEAKALLEALS